MATGNGVSNSAAATQASQDMGDTVVAIRTTIDKIQDEVQAAAKGWRGQASKAFNDAALAWDQEARRLKAILDEMGTHVGVGANRLTEMDANNDFGGLKL
ncbi:WXG100 family type VII secretion target [Nocardia altamirensis]|uniref:WXG100 family type VII secretion target n=1 Tax=Nocardia altamirensis TaxID=472158 RepID=UPI0009FD3C03|nr:WXG100 family type VII secretion target [Nocardia altamirensis]